MKYFWKISRMLEPLKIPALLVGGMIVLQGIAGINYRVLGQQNKGVEADVITRYKKQSLLEKQLGARSNVGTFSSIDERSLNLEQLSEFPREATYTSKPATQILYEPIVFIDFQ